MTHPQHDHPFAVWTVFRDAPQWWLERGCPPTVDCTVGSLRILRAAVLTTITSVGAAIVSCSVIGFLLMTHGPAHDWFGLLFGLVYAALALVPLSRWVGRPWWLAAVSVPYFGLACWRLDDLWMRVSTWYGGRAYHEELTWGTMMMLLGAALGLWMLAPSQRWTWLIPLATVAAPWIGAASLGAANWVEARLHLPVMNGPLLRFILRMQPLILFLALTAIAMSLRLWWREEQNPHAAPAPAANTAATGAANPSSSTDVAVSPDLNVPCTR